MTGFNSKQRTAADKLKELVPSDAFERWWYYEGSGPPYTHHDCEEHTKRMCKIAWSNGADVAAQPAQREWVGLTVQERNDCLVQADPNECLNDLEAHQLMVEVEAKLKEKNL